MLHQEPHGVHVAARLLDFFGGETSWQRRLWDAGTLLTLREILEGGVARASGTLSAQALRWLQESAIEVAGRDPGIGDIAEHRLLKDALKADVLPGGFASTVIRQIADASEERYLERWSVALGGSRGSVGPERVARFIAGHLLGVGFSPSYLHRWWTYKIRHEPGERHLHEIVADAHDRARLPLRTYPVLVPLRRASSRAWRVPGWLEAAAVNDWMRAHGQRELAGPAGGLLLEIEARDDHAAVEQAAEQVDRFITMVTLGSPREQLAAEGHGWVVTESKVQRQPLRRRRGVEVAVLDRREEPLVHPVSPRIDAALELLAPLDRGPAAPAVSGAWAAIETLLVAPGDQGKGDAGDRLATLVACSFPRAELTRLAHQYTATHDDHLAELIRTASTNTRKAAAIAEELRASELSYPDPSDQAASARMRLLLTHPAGVLGDVERHVIRSIRRLYRVRNLILHGGMTDAEALPTALRAAAPLVSAGVDRVVRAQLLDAVSPIELVARARIAIETSDAFSPGAFADLLRLSD